LQARNGREYGSRLAQTMAAETGRAIGLSSPVASLVRSLVLSTVVTVGSSRLEFRAIPIRRVPVLRDRGCESPHLRIFQPKCEQPKVLMPARKGPPIARTQSTTYEPPKFHPLTPAEVDRLTREFNRYRVPKPEPPVTLEAYLKRHAGEHHGGVNTWLDQPKSANRQNSPAAGACNNST